ncbi:membrane protein [Clostridium sulfidigenes]|uniref:Membrane protein n=1 Tax=Clostridium sulfidigenes TaxID=318464 RepID=A0A084JAG4_9CLOT|nr:DMT family transporter [Clostridium sulfidigenes]KEZ85948.1 membrane protein [Clostridium sulfidigenes]
MTKTQLKANILLLLTAAIWGLAFVAQKVGAEHVGAFTYNGIRFALGSISLIPLILFLNKKKRENEETQNNDRDSLKLTVKAGIIAGCALFIATSLQQMGVMGTTAGKAGFITGLYMVIVPILGLFLKQKVNKSTWIGIVIAIIGLYLLSINEDFSISNGDLLVLIGSVGWAVHILLIDNFTKKIDPLKLSSVQFATCSILSLVMAIIFEDINMVGISGAMVSILYGGLLSVGVAYTLQVVAQKNAKPSHAAILLSMESVFGALGGAMFLGERIGARGLVGCILIFIAIIISQLKPSEKGSKDMVENI